jgi:hypothetical protein
MPAVALSFTHQQPVQLSRAVNLTLPPTFGHRVTVGLALETGHETGVRLDFGLPSRVAQGTTPGTVPHLVPQMPSYTTFVASNNS